MTKISALPADTAPTTDDEVATRNVGTSTTQRVTLANLITLFFTQTNIPAGGGSPTTRFDEAFYDFVASGGVWTADSAGVNRNASMTAAIIYVNGRRISINAVGARTFTASKDTYIDVLDNADGTGTLVYTEVANNAASPSLAANSIRIGIIVTGATFITNSGSINQGEQTKLLPIASSIPYAVTDSLGNMICCRTSNPVVIGYREILANFTATPGSGVYANVTGLSAPVIVPSGRKVKITVYTTAAQSSSAAAQVLYVAAREGSTELVATIMQITTAGYNSPQIAQVVLTPSAGLHTYLASIKTSSTGNVVFGATATSPGIIVVELV